MANWRSVRFVVLLLLVHRAKAKRPRFNLTFTEISCQPNPDYIVDAQCYVNENNHERFNVEFTFVRDILAANGNVTLDVLKPNGELNTLFTLQMDFCKFLSETSQNLLLRSLRGSVEKYTNFPKSCPIRKTSRIRVRNFTIDVNHIPSFTPEMVYQVKSFFYSEGFVMKFVVKGRLEENFKGSMNTIG